MYVKLLSHRHGVLHSSHRLTGKMGTIENSMVEGDNDGSNFFISFILYLYIF